MTTDLFFAPALPGKLPSSFQSDRTEIFSSAPGSKADAPGLSKHDKPDHFLNTLKKASRDQNSTRGSRRPDPSAEVRSAFSDRDSENDRVSDQQPIDDEIRMELISLLNDDESSPSDQSPVATELAELISLLEALGWTGSANDRMTVDGGGLAVDNISASVEKDQNLLAATAEKPLVLATVSKELEVVKSGGQFHYSSGSESSEKADSPKLNPEMRLSAEIDGSARDPKGTDSLPGNVNRNATPGGEPLQENTMKGDSLPVSKSLDDAAAGKDNSLKIDPVLTGDDGTKVVKPEGGTNDGGQWTSQSQTSERTAETPSTPKEAGGAQRELQTHTMEQIIRRAVFQIKDGQQEARIDLKPDFLGHVRMQIITENQQVTVKILTEFGFVKDMIENNIQQLKSDLQQQGLEVDKLDVSVSRDANGKNQQQENIEYAEKQPQEDHAGDDGNNSGDGQRDATERSARRADGLSTVDYFA